MFSFLNGRGPETPVAWLAGESVLSRDLWLDAQALAQRLPPQGTPINLCVDRYAFVMAWMAAMMRGQTSLMPPNPLPETLRQLQQGHPHPYLIEDEQGVAGLGLASLGLSVLTAHRRSVRSEILAPDAKLEPSAEVPAVCLLTSGSTDVPQPHFRTWRALLASTEAASSAIAGALGLPGLCGMNLLATVPPQHSYGLESSVMLALGAGAVLHHGRPFFPADITAGLARLPRPRALVTTPLHLKNLLRSGLDMPAVDLVLCATAPLSLGLAEQAERTLGPLVEIYGCTEAGQLATRRTVLGERWTLMGDLALRRVLSQGQETFLVRGGHLEGEIPLGDSLQLVDERQFYLRGRANDVINVAGKRNSLSHLNMQLNRIEGVVDGCFWLPDDRPDDLVRPVAFVVAPDLSAEQVMAALRQRVESAFVPRRIIHVAALPREATGKLTAQALRAFALNALQGLTS